MAGRGTPRTPAGTRPENTTPRDALKESLLSLAERAEANADDPTALEVAGVDTSSTALRLRNTRSVNNDAACPWRNPIGGSRTDNQRGRTSRANCGQDPNRRVTRSQSRERAAQAAQATAFEEGSLERQAPAPTPTLSAATELEWEQCSLCALRQRALQQPHQRRFELLLRLPWKPLESNVAERIIVTEGLV